MSIYIDKCRLPFGRMIMCHMIADSRAELHDMAEVLGLKRAWFQDTPKASAPHYDISLKKRDNAVKLGAILLERQAFVEVIRRIRAAGFP